MDQSWTQLETRCKLFEDYNSYTTLLKEAEVVLANRCSLFKQQQTILFSANNKSNAFKMPSTYKAMISVFIDGREIPHRDKSDWSFSSNSAGAMTVQDGIPSSYTIANDFITFDKVPTSGSSDLYYRANMPNSDALAKSVQIIPSGADFVYIDTTMGTLIDSLKVQYANGNSINVLDAIVYDNTFSPTSDFLNPSQSSAYSHLDLHMGNINFLKYQGGNWTTDAGTEYHKVTGEILEYRSKGPVIDNDYHLSLCDYAIYVATAMTDPAISDKHLQIWEARIQEILNQNIDKELPIGIREVV